MKLFAGGTETYGTGDYTAVLDSIKEVDNTFFLSDQTNADAGGSKKYTITNTCYYRI